MTQDTPPKGSSTPKALVAASAFPVLISFLPPAYAHIAMWVCVAMASMGLAATQIDIPKDDKTYKRFLYAALSFLASNWGRAVNAAVMLRGRK